MLNFLNMLYRYFVGMPNNIINTNAVIGLLTQFMRSSHKTIEGANDKPDMMRGTLSHDFSS